MLNTWFNNYVDGLSNKTKPLAEYRGLKQGINGGDTNSNKSQSGYIKIGNINENKLFDKLTNNNDKLKSVNLNDKINYIDQMDEAEKTRITSELNTNLSKEQRKRKNISKAIGNYYYTAKNIDFNNYKFTGRYLIDDLYR